MDVVQDPATGGLLCSKLSPPQAATGFYMARPRVDAALAANPHVRLVLFCAPAGFGKTTALADFAARRQEEGAQVVWLSLGCEDDDPSRFFQQLIDALGQALPGFGQEALGYLCNPMGVPVAVVMEHLLSDLARVQTPMLLVLDDLHLLQDGELLAALNRMVKLAPASFVLAAGSRSLPALNLATLRAKGLLLELGAEELRLSPKEMGQYLEHAGVQLDAAALKALYAHTEGWMIGVHLASLWLRNQPQPAAALPEPLADQHAVGDYLLHTVFEQLPAARQDQLLALGVARQLSGDLASALTGRQNGQQLLEELEALQLFLLPLDRERQWYRFHNLFAEFLRTRLRERDPERFRQLHFNASLWFTNHHMQNLAIEHASLAEDPEMLAALLDGCGLELINRGQLGLLYRWRKQVPDEVAARFPVLVLADVWTRATDMSLVEAYRLLDELLERWGSTRDNGPLSERLLATLAIKAVIALQKDDLDTCVLLARRIEAQLGQHTAFLEVAILIVGALALVMLGQADPARRLLALAQQRSHFLEGHYLDMQLSNVEVVLCLEQGRLKQAQLLFQQLRERFTAWFDQRSRALVLPTITESLIDYRQGRFDELQERLRWALATIDVINPIDLYAQAMLCLARVQRMQGATKEAAATLVLMQNLAARNQSWRFYVQAVGEEIALILQEPQVDRCKRAEQRLKSVDWNKLAEPYQSRALNPVLWVLGLTRIRLQQARGHYSEALHELAQLRAQLQGGLHDLQSLRLDLLAALSYQRLGYQERAQSLLVQCLICAEREGARSVFIEEGEAIRQLLQQLEAAERQPALQGFLRSLLGIWPGREAQQALDVLEEGLTEREREVVCLAAKGLSNDEIGQQLALALGTVKWHLHNIYEKLKVRNRTQAIRRARELSLLEP